MRTERFGPAVGHWPLPDGDLSAAIAAATGRHTIPQAEWDRVRVFLPQTQRVRVMRERAFDRADAVKAHRIYPEELVARRGELVTLFRASMSRELESIGCLDDARCIWSMWPGYLRGDVNRLAAHAWETDWAALAGVRCSRRPPMGWLNATAAITVAKEVFEKR